MLVLGREVGEVLEIHLDKNSDPNMTVGELLSQGPIKVILVEMNDTWGRIGIEAPKELRILRAEIVK